MNKIINGSHGVKNTGIDNSVNEKTETSKKIEEAIENNGVIAFLEIYPELGENNEIKNAKTEKDLAQILVRTPDNEKLKSIIGNPEISSDLKIQIFIKANFNDKKILKNSSIKRIQEKSHTKFYSENGKWLFIKNGKVFHGEGEKSYNKTVKKIEMDRYGEHA